MNELLTRYTPGDVLMLAMVSGFVLWMIVITIVGYFSATRKAELEQSFKLQMLQRGFTAEQMLVILQAKDDEAGMRIDPLVPVTDVVSEIVEANKNSSEVAALIPALPVEMNADGVPCVRQSIADLINTMVEAENSTESIVKVLQSLPKYGPSQSSRIADPVRPPLSTTTCSPPDVPLSLEMRDRKSSE